MTSTVTVQSSLSIGSSDTVFQDGGLFYWLDEEGERSIAYSTHEEAMQEFVDYCNWMNEGGANG